MICPATELFDTEMKHLEKGFVKENNYPKWVIGKVFTQVKIINDSNLSPPTIEIEVPANDNELVNKKAYVTSTLSKG